ncbi:MAG TPA: acetyl-CoA decarbonylase/synthase complex subunit gamma, partial [Chitinivibrionales bacterium]
SGALFIGEETVMYRHEKTFEHQTALGVNINDNDDAAGSDATLKAIRDYSVERVGEKLSLDVVGITQKARTPEDFARLASKAWETTGKPLVLRGENPDALVAAARAVKGSRSVLCLSGPADVEALRMAAMENNHALALGAPDLDALVALTTHMKKDGFNDLMLMFQTYSEAERFQTNSISRRAALKDECKALGYPSVSFVGAGELLDEASEAITEIVKYGGICIMPRFDPALVVSLLTLRQNIYTDPQKPIQVEPKMYPVGEPKPDSPVFVTTNFSLTYFIVSGEIENSGISAWLVVPECEGMSVLTAWAAGKFSGASIAKFIKEKEIEKALTTRSIVIPGYVSQISGELEENLPGWKVLVGPQEAGDLESFIKAKVKI